MDISCKNIIQNGADKQIKLVIASSKEMHNDGFTDLHVVSLFTEISRYLTVNSFKVDFQKGKHSQKYLAILKELTEVYIGENDALSKSFKQSDALIMAGGFLSNGGEDNFSKMTDEIYEVINAQIPCYLIGVFGGATKTIIDLLEGCQKKEIEVEKQIFFKSKGIIGLNNGLSIEENEILFTSSNTSQIVSLIMKGLKKTLK